MTDSMRCPGMRDLLPEEMGAFVALSEAFRVSVHGLGIRGGAHADG